MVVDVEAATVADRVELGAALFPVMDSSSSTVAHRIVRMVIGGKSAEEEETR